MTWGIPVANAQLDGTALGRLAPFANLTGIGLVLGYAVPFLAFMVACELSTVARSNLAERTWALAFPLFTVLFGAHGTEGMVSFAMTLVFFVAAFITLGAMFWPCMVPCSITVANAAAPEASLSFLFYGAGVAVLPAVLIPVRQSAWPHIPRNRGDELFRSGCWRSQRSLM